MTQTKLGKLAFVGGLIVIGWLGYQVGVSAGNWIYNSAKGHFYGQIERYGYFCGGGVLSLNDRGFIPMNPCDSPENKARDGVRHFYENQLRK